MSLRNAGRGLTVLLLCLTSHFSLRGQTPRSGPHYIPSAVNIGLTYLGVDTDLGPSVAAEVTYLGTTPRIWRTGVIGGLIASTQGTVYGYGGLHLPIPLPLGLFARPSFSVGLYEKGQGMELGHTLEFRSSFALERAFSDGLRVSTMLYHLSNAGLGFKNPGLEAVGVAVAVPLSTGAR